MASSTPVRILLVAALCVTFIGAAQAQMSPQLAQKAPQAAELATIAAQSGFVRVIVQFAAPGVPSQLRPEAEFLAPIKTQIASTQDAIIASQFGSATNPSEGQGFSRSLVRFDIRPMFAVNVSLAELTALAADSRIVSIYHDAADGPGLVQSVPLIGMPAAYSAGATGDGQAVAILDSGVQSNHVFLSDGLVFRQACFSTTANAQDVSLCPKGGQTQIGPDAADTSTAACVNPGGVSICSHGTHVAGIAAGNNTEENDLPANGVAKNARIIAVQVFHRVNDATVCNREPTPCLRTYSSDQVRALDWLFQTALVPEAGVRLAAVNMSIQSFNTFSAACDGDVRKPSMDALRRVGVATVTISGNFSETDQISAPGCVTSGVTVGSSTKTDTISPFSNMSQQVALLAPGGLGGGQVCDNTGVQMNTDILSSISGPSTAQNAIFGCMAGTSMAAPHVAGAFAAIRTVCANASVDQIVAFLQNTGLAITDTRAPNGVTKQRIRVDLAVQSMGCAVHDFNGDGKSDILWRDNNGNAAVWLMNGQQGVQSAAVIGAKPPTWSIVGQRDFNGDGKYDLLWRDPNGNVVISFMNGTQVASEATVANIPITWSVVGTGNFAGIGQGGILWRDTAGNTAIWLMNGAEVASGGSLGNPSLTFSVVGTGDFNGDGMTDILWRDTAGNVAIWFMNGAQVLSSAVVGAMSPAVLVAGTGDFDGDGRCDIVWRDASGNTFIWFMNGAQVTLSAVVGTVPDPWSVAQVGDYNGDGLADLLWRDTSGDIAIWLMQGALVVSTLSLGILPTTWMIQSVNAY